MILNTIKWILVYLTIQAVSFILAVIGFPVIAIFSLLKIWRLRPINMEEDLPAFPKWAWIWDNQEDGIFGVTPQGFGRPWTRWNAFYWSAIRNPVANLRHVPGVSGVGRPLLYKTFMMFKRQFYVKFGWMSDGFPACSVGSGRGY